MPRSEYGYPTPLRNLPGVGPLEWALAQEGWTPDNTEKAEALSEYLFGISRDETWLWVDGRAGTWLGGVELIGIDRAGIDAKAADWEKHFDVLKLFRDESDAYWASVGWDVTDGEGKQLEVMRELARPLVCFVKRIHADAYETLCDEGHAEDAEAWGERLAEEARLFKPKR